MSERERIKHLTECFAAPQLVVGNGDDAAVVRPGGAVTVTSVDAVVDGIHFELASWPIHAVGYKAVAAALSDLAAMGAAVGEIYVAAGLPRELSEPDFEQLARGIADAASASGALVAGGDLVASGQLWLSVTVVGHAAAADAVVTRGGAQPGELVVVTGTLGGSARALGLIEPGVAADDVRLAKQFTPTPRLAAGAILAASGAGAMIDISDGLLGDAGQIARASDVALTLELARLPLAAEVTDPLGAAVSGEEYELLATLPQSALAEAERTIAATGTTLTVVGRVSGGAGVRLVDAEGVEVEVERRGFDHFD
jgi:thiamine-monophosphate kinase